MIVHIVIDESKDILKSYKEVYRVFSDPIKALEHAEECGYSFFFLRPTLEIGRKCSYQCGDKNISIMTVEVEE